MIVLSNIRKSFENAVALDNVQCEIQAAKTTVLIGPSGCGKSTLIRLIVGLASSDTGKIYIEDELLNQSNILKIRHKIGYVIQEGGLFPHLTGRSNISLLAKHLKWDRARIGQRINQLADLTKFPIDALDRYPAQLSGGQQQRISLMRALMLDPPILLLDEPLGSLDPMIRYDLQQDLKNIFRSLHKTVLMVTHDLSEAEFFADEIILMKDGKIVQKGLIADFKDQPADDFVTRFVKAQRYLSDNDKEISG
jgi:osmoprotectant transport system ATP-binding protein